MRIGLPPGEADGESHVQCVGIETSYQSACARRSHRLDPVVVIANLKIYDNYKLEPKIKCVNTNFVLKISFLYNLTARTSRAPIRDSRSATRRYKVDKYHVLVVATAPLPFYAVLLTLPPGVRNKYDDSHA